MDAKIYNQEGKETGKITLSDAVFNAPWNADLVHQVVTAMQANSRTPIAHTKDRGEVRGGGKKPWRQKGTGRARHGSRRSPIWIGGGVTHGPRNEKNYKRKINKKMRIKALYSVLSEKARSGEVLFVDELSFEEAKTAKARSVLQNLSTVNGFDMLFDKKRNAALVVTAAKNDSTYKSFSNFSNIAIGEVRNLNPVDVLNYKYLIIVEPEESMKLLSEKEAKMRNV